MNKSLVGGTVKKPLQVIIVILGVLVVLFGIGFIDTFVYPLHSDRPNYSDVEKTFAKLQFPSDWKEVDSSENRGIHGRGCDPFNDSGCFHKNKTFKVDDTQAARVSLKEIFTSLGCTNVDDEATYEGNSNATPKTATNLSCRLSNGVVLGASISQQRGELSVGASTKQ
jgi:hypothetical protein